MPPYGATSAASTPPQKMLIVDDDVCFGALMSAVAKANGFEPRFFTSLVDMGSFARIREFDVAVIDYYLGSMRGDEIAEYVDTFFDDVPVIIVSSEDLTATKAAAKWPASVRRFVPKQTGCLKIVEAASSILKRDKLLKRFAASPRVAEPAARSV